jgi:hypothetical protein
MIRKPLDFGAWGFYRIAMRVLSALLCAMILLPVAAQAAHRLPPKPAAAPAGPKSIAKFGAWQAATHDESGHLACYAFTRALPSRVPHHAAPTADIVLTVTERPSGRDEVAVSLGNGAAPPADLIMEINTARLPFYAADHSAFARDGHAVVSAFAHARTARLRPANPHDAGARYDFSLAGYGPSYAAINHACPQ